ncbi:unnamed protein product [Parajaminaea phylloscopi]
MSLVIATILLASVAAAQNIPTPTEGAGYLPAPIAQPSIGGGAGPFQVSSLARSSNYDFNQNTAVQQTTTYAVPPASFAATSLAPGNYNTNSGSGVAQAAATGKSSSSRRATSVAPPSNTSSSNAGIAVRPSLTQSAFAAPLLAAVAAAFVGAIFVL